MLSTNENSPNSSKLSPNRFERWSKQAEELLFAILLLFMIGFGLLPVILRNFFQFGVSWTEPLIRQMVLWIALLGAGAATVDKKHITIDVVSNFVSPRWRNILGFITGLFSAVICAIFTWVSIIFVREEAQFSSPSSISSKIPEWIFELALPVGFSLLTLRLFQGVVLDFFAVIRDFRKRK